MQSLHLWSLHWSGRSEGVTSFRGPYAENAKPELFIFLPERFTVPLAVPLVYQKALCRHEPDNISHAQLKQPSCEVVVIDPSLPLVMSPYKGEGEGLTDRGNRDRRSCG